MINRLLTRDWHYVAVLSVLCVVLVLLFISCLHSAGELAAELDKTSITQ